MTARLNVSLTLAFRFFDRLPQETRDARQSEFEAQTAASGGHGELSPDALRTLRFQELFGPNVLESAMRDADVQSGMDPEASATRELNEAERARLTEYAEFLTFFDVPENRPALLAKLVTMEAPPRYLQDESWPQRAAFRRFLKEFYGEEKKRFFALDGQADLVQAWSMKGGWNFTEEEFREMRARIPEARQRLAEYRDEELVAPVLVPRLPDKDRMPGPRRTYEALWSLAAAGQMRSRRWDREGGGRAVTLMPDAAYAPGLSFEIIGLADHQGISAEASREKRKPRPPADVGVLAAAAEHPDWLEALDGLDVPYVCAAGYTGETEMGSGAMVEAAPCLSFDKSSLSLGLDMDPAFAGADTFAMPTVRDSFRP